MNESNQVLVIVDPQVAMVDDDPHPFNRDAVLANLKDVLTRARANESQVVLVADGHSTRDSPALTARQIIDYHNALLVEVARQELTTASDDLFG